MKSIISLAVLFSILSISVSASAETEKNQISQAEACEILNLDASERSIKINEIVNLDENHPDYEKSVSIEIDYLVDQCYGKGAI